MVEGKNWFWQIVLWPLSACKLWYGYTCISTPTKNKYNTFLKCWKVTKVNLRHMCVSPTTNNKKMKQTETNQATNQKLSSSFMLGVLNDQEHMRAMATMLNNRNKITISIKSWGWRCSPEVECLSWIPREGLGHDSMVEHLTRIPQWGAGVLFSSRELVWHVIGLEFYPQEHKKKQSQQYLTIFLHTPSLFYNTFHSTALYITASWVANSGA